MGQAIIGSTAFATHSSAISLSWPICDFCPMSQSPMSAGINVPEEQPLLSNTKPPSYHDDSPESLSRTQDEEALNLTDETSDSPKEPWTRRQITVYAVLTLLGLFILATFIKGFIDADDVNVSRGLTRALTSFLMPNVLISLTLERRSRVR